ncbi:class I SAM-dependent methyltransferase [Deinococcus irradiatisoli]|uniref:Class I SAM-dependent methyltransferase n=1 Tax=Deinococcus irradiatisoli TaxID=2202254 RepID=A0A2Z3JF11_9DEIO|nr:class I SAM-dependent methyltransferase [Deinococcus irradiatisoli]AWN23777.1 class I SAM-dependent methyltransferase [Deinococcus irradiatisoli]
MQPADAQRLIAQAVVPGEAWADLGAGRGTFTAALSALLGPGGSVLALDRDARALHSVRGVPGGAPVRTLSADFTALPSLPPHDGVLLANALHFVPDQQVVLLRLLELLRPPGKLLIVEYDMTRASAWVPHPLGFARLLTLSADLGWPTPQKLAEQPSRYHPQPIYAALITPLLG